MEKQKKSFQEYLSKKGLKQTQQREVILEAFLKAEAHISAEEFYTSLRKKHRNIGFATVYRTLKLFSEAGLANEMNFGDGQARYEYSEESEHHDNLICVECNKIVEFHNETIEEIQENIAKEHGFVLEKHRHELYGRCSNCQK